MTSCKLQWLFPLVHDKVIQWVPLHFSFNVKKPSSADEKGTASTANPGVRSEWRVSEISLMENISIQQPCTCVHFIAPMSSNNLGASGSEKEFCTSLTIYVFMYRKKKGKTPYAHFVYVSSKRSKAKVIFGKTMMCRCWWWVGVSNWELPVASN